MLVQWLIQRNNFFFMKKSSLLFFIGILFSLNSAAQSLDVSNHPDKDFFVGYQRLYKRFDDGSVCTAAYAEYRSGHKYINTNYLCEPLKLTKEQIYEDLMESMRYVKGSGSLSSFSVFFQWTGNKWFTDEPIQFCIMSDSGVNFVFIDYLFDKSGWKYVRRGPVGGRVSSAHVGFWRVESDGRVVLKTNNGINVVDMSKAVDCVDRLPYKKGRLLPSKG